MAGRETTTDGLAVIEHLRELPGGPELLDLAASWEGDVDLVGGAVRDLMLGRDPRELDVVVGDAREFASRLAQRLGALPGESVVEPENVTFHERFRTALIRFSQGRIDVASRRAESYPAPGALPDVRQGTPEQDLLRRDFTVNAIAVSLVPRNLGEIRSAPGALEDLATGRLRVMHERSFLDDPTRIVRLARYKTRLGFQVEAHTAALAEQAIAGGALSCASGQRIGAEVRLALSEPDPVAALGEIARMGVLQAWQPDIVFDEDVARAALASMPADGNPELLLVATMLVQLMWLLDREDTESRIWALLAYLELPSGLARQAFKAAICATCAVDQIEELESPADLLEHLDGAPVEGLALGAALCDAEYGPGSYARSVLEDWLYTKRHITLEITGEDLIAAGVPEGPEIGRRLQAAYEQRTFGYLDEGRDAELRAALDARV